MKKIWISAGLVLLFGALATGCMATKINQNESSKNEVTKRSQTESTFSHKEYFDAFKKEYNITDSQIHSLFSLHDEMKKDKKEIVGKILDGNFKEADIESFKSEKHTSLKKVFSDEQINKFMAKVEALHGKDFLLNHLNEFYIKRAEIIKEVSLSADQQSKIKTIILNHIDKNEKNHFAKMIEMHKNKFFGGNGNEHELFMKDFAKNKNEILTEVKKVLTPEQIVKLDNYIATHSHEKTFKTTLKLTDAQAAKLLERKSQFAFSMKTNIMDYIVGKIDITQYNTKLNLLFDSLKDVLSDEQVNIIKDKFKNKDFGFFMHAAH